MPTTKASPTNRAPVSPAIRDEPQGSVTREHDRTNREQQLCVDPQLSVIIPVFNEENTIVELVRRVLAAPCRKQILIVDDGSDDETAARLAQYSTWDEIEIITHPRNLGKGAAIRTALPYTRGAYTIVQDADLEYDPAEYPKLIEPLMRGEARVVYGSRYLEAKNNLPVTRYWLGLKILNMMVRVLFRTSLSDEATCYKAFGTDLLKSLELQCERFEFCPEVTAKVLKRGLRILEVPISYRCRTVSEGKKIGWRDAIEAAWTLLKYRIAK